MSIITNIISSFITLNIKSTLITLLLGFIVYKIVKFYLRVFQLPPGPLPIPILGNILALRGTKDHFAYELRKYRKKYGDVFTFWLGPNPFIFIADIDVARETFRKNEFIDRPQSFIAQNLSNKLVSDVVFDNYGHRWDALRRVSHAAVLNYAKTDKLAYLASDCVDTTFKIIMKKEGIDQPFDPYPYIYHMINNILATSAFGRGYDIDDKEYLKLKYALKDIGDEIGVRGMLWEFSPLIRYLDSRKVNYAMNLQNETMFMIRDKFKSHYESYDINICRDFCDALITAKNESLREAKESTPYLTDENLGMAVWDLFMAGTDTSQSTFRWLLLFLSHYSEVQKKLRQEIGAEIGDRMATYEDKQRCNYTMAFISETLRYRNSVPNGLFHATVVPTKFGKYDLPKSMGLFVSQWEIMNSEKYWENADRFLPERFLNSDGSYITTRPRAYIPFGVGRRVCLGEKLAIADLFFVLVRFLQLTENYDIVLSDYKNLDPSPNDPMAFEPNKYKIAFKIKNNN